MTTVPTHLCGCSSVVERHVANVNVGRSNRLTRFKQCIALARITSHLCGVYLFIGDSISSMLFASTRTVLHRFVQGFGTVSGTVVRASCTVFLRLVVRNARCFKLMHNAHWRSFTMNKKYKCILLGLGFAIAGVILYEVLDRSNMGIWLGGLGLLAFMVLGLVGVFGCKSDWLLALISINTHWTPQMTLLYVECVVFQFDA